MSKKPKSSIGNQPATKYKKPKNARSLVHDYANGINANVRVGNLSFRTITHNSGIEHAQSGILSTALDSYALRIGHRVENFRKKQITFVCYDGVQSVTTRKHMGWLSRSIPLPVVMHPSSTSQGELTPSAIAEHFACIKHNAKEDFKFPKTPLVIYLENVNGAMLCPLSHAGEIYKSFCSEIESFCFKISNSRVHKFPACWVKRYILEIEKSKEFRKRFCPLSPAHNFRKAEKIIIAYLLRIAVRNEKKAQKIKERNDLAETIASRNLPVFDSVILELKKLETTYRDLHLSAWLNYEKVSNDLQDFYYSSRRNQVNQIGNLCPKDKTGEPVLQTYDLIFAFNRITGRDWDTETGQSGLTAMLRVSKSGEEIETSDGANLPLSLCQSLWNRHGQIFSQIIAGESVEDKLPIALGHFNFIDVTDGVCRVGCHRIKAEEFISLAQRMNWKT